MQTPPKYEAVIEWLTTALATIAGANAKITLNVNGGAIEADLETTDIELDSRGRKVKVKRIATTHLSISEVKRSVLWR